MFKMIHCTPKYAARFDNDATFKFIFNRLPIREKKTRLASVSEYYL